MSDSERITVPQLLADMMLATRLATGRWAADDREIAADLLRMAIKRALTAQARMLMLARRV